MWSYSTFHLDMVSGQSTLFSECLVLIAQFDVVIQYFHLDMVSGQSTLIRECSVLTLV